MFIFQAKESSLVTVGFLTAQFSAESLIYEAFVLMGEQGGTSLYCSDQRTVIFPANRNRNKFAEPTSVLIEIGIVHESQTCE